MQIIETKRNETKRNECKQCETDRCETNANMKRTETKQIQTTNANNANETKRTETKPNNTKRTEPKRTETNANNVNRTETKRKDCKQCETNRNAQPAAAQPFSIGQPSLKKIISHTHWVCLFKNKNAKVGSAFGRPPRHTPFPGGCRTPLCRWVPHSPLQVGAAHPVAKN